MAEPPVLWLSHFCARPFVCFGDVRPGAARTRPLALANPHAEPVRVALPRLPAAARGFGVRPRAFELQVRGAWAGAGARGRRPGPRRRGGRLPLGGPRGPASGARGGTWAVTAHARGIPRRGAS